MCSDSCTAQGSGNLQVGFSFHNSFGVYGMTTSIGYDDHNYEHLRLTPSPSRENVVILKSFTTLFLPRRNCAVEC